MTGQDKYFRKGAVPFKTPYKGHIYPKVRSTDFNSTFGLGITLERRLAERSSSIASENPVPKITSLYGI